MVWVRLGERVVLEGAEPPGEADLRLGREVALVAEEQHEVLLQQLLECAHEVVVVRGARQVDARHLGADGRVGRPDVDALTGEGWFHSPPPVCHRYSTRPRTVCPLCM